MSDRHDELEGFKRGVNLTEYAATRGFQLDRKASSRNSAVMVHPAGDKIIVAKGSDGHWVYFSVRDPADHGSIVDFVQRRQGGTIGDVRKALRPWTGGPLPSAFTRPPPSAFVRDLDHIPRDLAAVRARFEAMEPANGRQPYLEDVRRIPAAVLADPAFADRIRTDAYGGAVFPHYTRGGLLCGYEIKNQNYTGFASGGTKGLFVSRRTAEDDRRLVIAETAIDALSYAAVRGQPATRYASTGGELNPEQPELLVAAIAGLPDGAEVVLAVDHDDGGAKIGRRIEAAFAAAARSGLSLRYDRPPTPGEDWNDELRKAAGRPMPKAGQDYFNSPTS